MKRLNHIIAAVVCLALAAGVAHAGAVDLDQMDELTKTLPFAIQMGTPGGEDHRFLYADFQTHVHVYRVKDDGLKLDWETTNLGSRVSSMFVADLYGDGDLKLAISTAAGRIVLYTMDGYDLEWENLQDPFDRVHYMVSHNVDEDPQQELIFIADSKLHIFDSLNKNFEWSSQTEFDARQIVVANVDDDDQPEIILNTGTVVDSRFYTIEFQADNVFGDRISLLDINGDGVPEIFGELLDFTLKIFDLYAEREIW